MSIDKIINPVVMVIHSELNQYDNVAIIKYGNRENVIKPITAGLKLPKTILLRFIINPEMQITKTAINKDFLIVNPAVI